MPINQDSVPVFFPEKNYKLGKYMDIPKFMSLLHKEALFFCRLDILEDKFEGLTTDQNWKSRRNDYWELVHNGFFKKESSEVDIEQFIIDDYEFQKRLKSIRIVNCWNKFEEESVALWKIYAENGKGILVSSSRNCIMESLEKSHEIIHMSEISYIDFEKDEMPDGGDIYPVIHKQKAFKYEKEIRLIHEVESEPGFVHDWTKETNFEGRYINVNLDVLIHEIIIGPYSPKWTYDLISDFCNKYGLSKSVRFSKLKI